MHALQDDEPGIAERSGNKRATMTFIWSLTLYELAKGFRVVIKGNGHTVQGEGRTPQEAHRAAEIQLVVKPWVAAEHYQPAVSELDDTRTAE